MIANYHTHTWRCNHAWGTEEEYVERAIDRGLKFFGFSDHTPYPFPEGYYSSFRMKPELLENYTTVILDLRERYRDRIDIRLGVEAEYYPVYFPELMSLLRDSPVEYMILGQHYTGNELDGSYSGRRTGSEETLIDYCDQVVEALETGLFSYVAHPDLLNFQGSGRFYEEQMRRICRCAKSCGIPVELNLLGLQERRHYPNERFWAVAAEEGCTAVLGCDAHRAEAVSDTETERKARAWAREFGVPIVDTIPLRRIDH